MDGPQSAASRRQFLGAAVSMGAAALWSRALGATAPVRPPTNSARRTLRLALALPVGAVPADRARSVTQAVRFALADAAANLGVPRTALEIINTASDMRASARLAHAGALATSGRVAAVLAATSPAIDDWLRHRTRTAGARWILLPATVTGSIATLPPDTLQVGRDDLAVAGAVARWLDARPRRTLVISDSAPRAGRFERALRSRLRSDAVWDVVGERTLTAGALAERMGAAHSDRLVLNASPQHAGTWLPAIRPLLARTEPAIVAPQWSEATLAPADFDALAGLVWVSTWHPSMGGSERNWARRHRARTGMVPGDAEIAAYSAALAALLASPQLGPHAEVRDLLVPGGAQFGADGCLPHGTQVRRRLPGIDEYGWANQRLLAAATPAQAFADRRTG